MLARMVPVWFQDEIAARVSGTPDRYRIAIAGTLCNARYDDDETMALNLEQRRISDQRTVRGIEYVSDARRAARRRNGVDTPWRASRPVLRSCAYSIASQTRADTRHCLRLAPPPVADERIQGTEALASIALSQALSQA
jgi:hypothetical protein